MEAEEITTYQEMNEKIVDLLKFQGDNYCLYAAKRIMELEVEVKKLSLNPPVIGCACTSDERTGWTQINCCNVCGRPMDKLWCRH